MKNLREIVNLAIEEFPKYSFFEDHGIGPHIVVQLIADEGDYRGALNAIGEKLHAKGFLPLLWPITTESRREMVQKGKPWWEEIPITPYGFFPIEDGSQPLHLQLKLKDPGKVSDPKRLLTSSPSAEWIQRYGKIMQYGYQIAVQVGEKPITYLHGPTEGEVNELIRRLLPNIQGHWEEVFSGWRLTIGEGAWDPQIGIMTDIGRHRNSLVEITIQGNSRKLSLKDIANHMGLQYQDIVLTVIEPYQGNTRTPLSIRGTSYSPDSLREEFHKLAKSQQIIVQAIRLTTDRTKEVVLASDDLAISLAFRL